VAKGIREREFQNLMIQWSLPMGLELHGGQVATAGNHADGARQPAT
jgi:hypothetical protein